MNRPYSICHMMASLDGRIDCTMTAKCPGVEEYYQTLSALDIPTTVSGRVTAQLELASQGIFEAADKTPIGKKAFSKKSAVCGYSVVVDTRGTLLWESDLVDGKPLIVVMSEAAGREYAKYLDRKNISWIACGKEKIDLVKAGEILYTEFDVKRMGIVGGGSINAGFLDAGLLDEISMLYAPAIDGRGGMKAAFDGLPTEREPFLLHLQSVRQFADGSVWMRYKVKQ